MAKTLFSILFIICSVNYVNSQNNALVINNNAFIVMDGGVFIVVDQSHQNGIITTGSGGNIVSEDETNKIRWEIATNTGTYTVPFTTTPVSQGGNGVKIPYSLEIQAAGIGANAHIDLSTYETSTDMNIPWASMVTQMNDADIPNFDNSLNVMDRFWIIDANSYSTKPDPRMVFGYDDNANEIGGTNTISEVNLVAQRFDDASNTWGGDFSNSVNFWGSSNIASNLVSGVDVDVANFFPAWVLVNKFSILPITLENFNGECFTNKIQLNWNTKSEINNDYFTIEKSLDSENWTELAIVNGAGNSANENSYSYEDYSVAISNFYRISQTDIDGTKTFLKTIFVTNCESNDINIYNSKQGEFTISINAPDKSDYLISFYDMRGRKVIETQKLEAFQGQNDILLSPNLTTGIYTIVVESKYNHFVKKIVLN